MTPREIADEAREQRLRGWLLAALAGDAAAYHAFLRDLAGYLRGFLRRRLSGWPDEVEDLVQETLLAVHKQRASYDAALPLTAWLHALARYKLIDWMRRHGRQGALHDPIDDDLEVLAVSDEAATDARRDLRKLLDTLPERQRLPIVCTKLEGLSVQETARLTGMSESAVKVGVHRGMKALMLRVKDT